MSIHSVCKNPGWCLVKGLRQHYVKHNMYCKDLNEKMHTWKAMSGTESQEWFSRFSFLGVSFYHVPFEVKLHDLYLVTTLSVDLGCHWSFLGSKNRTGRPCENCSHNFFWSRLFFVDTEGAHQDQVVSGIFCFETCSEIGKKRVVPWH